MASPTELVERYRKDNEQNSGRKGEAGKSKKRIADAASQAFSSFIFRGVS
jgi:hypothetical protein